MCGIAGIVGERQGLEGRAARLLENLHHRGPDDNGIWYQSDLGLALVHARLSILDLSPAGHQPMSTNDGRYTIVFNGEIYNFRELRNELVRAGVPLRSHSDTEVVLQMFAKEGPSMLTRLAGMFALAIWDQRERKLFLARDPLGIKPLYYWQVGQKFAFASEVRALLSTKLGTVSLDPNAMQRYLLMGSVQEPDTLISGVSQLPAGNSAEFNGERLSVHRYWHATYSEAIQGPSEAVATVRNSFLESVKRHYVSDVPVGMFLSGGIDSTAVVAAAREIGQSNLQTFSISFDDPAYDEGGIAARTARHFGTEHHDWKMTPADGQALIGDFLDATDLPSNDGFNTYCVSLFAKRNGLKVVLSGLGGDEVFGGYPSFSRVPKWVTLHRRLGLLRGILKYGIKLAEKIGMVDANMAGRTSAFLQSRGGFGAAYWMGRAFFTPSEASEIVRQLTGSKPQSVDGGLFSLREELPSKGNEVGYLECTRYMRNQLLRDSDVMSMVHGLELRVPLVDQRLFDSVNSIAAGLRFRTNKQLLLDAMPEIPEWVWNRKKQGFRFPFEQWVNHHWKDQFNEVTTTIGVPLDKWYRKWTVLCLLNFIKRASVA